MTEKQFNTDNAMIQMVMVLKRTKLKYEQLPSLKYDNLEDYINKYLWKKEAPTQLNQAVNAILSISANDIVRFMATRCVIDSVHESLSDYADLIRRN